MNGKIIEDFWEKAEGQLDLAYRLAKEQFEGMAPGLSEVSDEIFYALFMMRQMEYGPDFARALDAKKEDGTDLIPGGRNQLRRFMKIQAQRSMAAMGQMWNPEPYEEEQDGNLG